MLLYLDNNSGLYIKTQNAPGDKNRLGDTVTLAFGTSVLITVIVLVGSISSEVLNNSDDVMVIVGVDGLMMLLDGDTENDTKTN